MTVLVRMEQAVIFLPWIDIPVAVPLDGKDLHVKNVTTVPLSPVEMVPPAPHSGMVIDALVCLDIMDLTVTWTSMNATVVTTMILVSMEDVSTLMVATNVNVKRAILVEIAKRLTSHVIRHLVIIMVIVNLLVSTTIHVNAIQDLKVTIVRRTLMTAREIYASMGQPVLMV
jgi:hypothetical protein